MFMTSIRSQWYRLFALGVASLLSMGCAAQTPHSDKPHHTNDGFRNVYPYEQPSFFDFLKWRWNRLWKK